MSYLVTDPRAKQKQVGCWLQSQIHDEFELAAKSMGLKKGELLRQLIEQYVSQMLKREAA